MGQVYLATDTAQEGRRVALKVLKDRETVEWFKREFETLSLMAHPNIAQVYDFDHDRPRKVYHYTCEYVEGRPADDVLAGRSFEEKLSCFVQVLKALQYIHAQGYLHCDIKPGNVLVKSGPSGLEARVLDFGLAMAVPRASMTARGTLSYMAPEWFSGGVPGAYTDLYSAGIMFYEIAYGRLPFSAADSQSCVNFHTRGEMAFPDDPAVPAWFPKLLVRMTSREPADRLTMARECLSTLQRLSGLDLKLAETAGALEGGVGGPWLGRSEVLQAGLQMLQRVRRGDLSGGGCLFVDGEEGVGKTRLLSELKRRIQLAGGSALHLASRGRGRGVFSALVALVRGLGADEPAGRQEKVSHMVTRLVERLLASGRDGELVLFLDGLDEMEEQVAAVVEGLLHAQEFAIVESGGKTARVTVIAAVRDASALPAGLAGHVLTRRHTLPALVRGDTERLLKLALGLPEIPAPLLDEAWAASRGNPKLVTELASFLQETGAVELAPGGVLFHKDRLPRGGLPRSIAQSLEQSWERFAAPERKVLRVLSAAYVPQPLPVVAELSGLEVWQVDQVLAQLGERGHLAYVRVGDRELPSVESDALRQVALGGVEARELRQLHMKMARHLAARPRLVEEHPEQLGWHLFHAGKGKDALPHALAGARQLLGTCDFRRAMEMLDVARQAGAEPRELADGYYELYRLWGRHDRGIEILCDLLAATQDDGDRRRIQMQLAELHFRAGAYERASTDLVTLAEDSEVGGQAQALLARVYFFLGRQKEAREIGEKGMLALPQDSRDFALCAAMVGLVRVYEGKLAQGVKYLETALGVLERAGTPTDASFAANAVALGYHKLKDYGNAERYYRKALETASAAGDHDRVNISSMNLSVLLQEMGDYSRAIASYEEALAMAFRSQNLPVLARMYSNLGNIHRYLGMLQKARDFAERAVELADKLNQQHDRGLNRMLAGEVLLLEGRHDEARVLLDEAARMFATAGAADEGLEAAINRVELLTAMERRDEACAAGNEAVEKARHLRLDNHRLRAILATARALLLRNGPEDPGLAVGLLQEAEGLSPSAGNPELEFRLLKLLTQGYGSLGESERASATLQRAENALTVLRSKIPEDYQSVFFNRPDRKRELAEFASLSSRMVQLAQTVSPVGGVSVQTMFAGRPRWVTELIRMNERLVAEEDVDKLLEKLIDVVVDLSGAERGFVLLRAGAGLDAVVARNMDREAIRRSRSKFSTSIARKVLETGRQVRLEDAIEADDFRSKESIMALRIRSVVCLPVMGRDGPIGAMYLDNRFRPGVFSESVMEMLSAFTEQAAIAIQIGRLLAGYRATVNQLEQSQEEVKRLNEELKERVQVQELVIEQKTRELARQQSELEDRFQFANIVGRSGPMRAMFTMMSRVMDTHVPVLVLGESGSGKELVARALHYEGPRRKEKFVSINCAALPDTLLESELFGYKEGAFTDARKEKKGLFALADKGTLMLDEVGDMSLTMQAKLLRVLQEGELTPLGGEQAVKVDVRLICATNRDLKLLVREGRFRQDLYYRLDVVTITVPPLRDRKEDISLLVEHFLSDYAERNQVPRPRMSLQAMQVLLAHGWPGNVRELQSVVTTSAVFAEGGQITLQSLQAKPEVFGNRGPGGDALPLADTLELKELERRALAAALLKAEGNKQQAARILGISRRALYNKLEAYKIDVEKLLGR
jgi:transcriptional regulator with GAF, ATPase, and Fis domain/lipopolysaccharide biosynthesis regulator YciM